jgi:hypothetical protein
MKILDTPRSGKCGQTVAFQSRYGLCLRQHVPQKAGLTPARQHACAVFGGNSRKWGARLSDEQHDWSTTIILHYQRQLKLTVTPV